MEGILSVLNEKGYQMLLAVTQNDPQKELEYLERICDKVGSISLNGAGNILEQLAGLTLPKESKAS